MAKNDCLIALSTHCNPPPHLLQRVSKHTPILSSNQAWFGLGGALLAAMPLNKSTTYHAPPPPPAPYCKNFLPTYIPQNDSLRSQEMLHNPCILGVPNKGDKTRSGFITPALSGAQRWAEMQHNPCILGGCQQRGQNQKWLHYPCLLGGPKVGGNARQPLHARGSPTKGTKSKMVT